MPTRILVVEDDADIAQLVARYLEKGGLTAEILAAAAAPENAPARETLPPDVVLIEGWATAAAHRFARALAAAPG